MTVGVLTNFDIYMGVYIYTEELVKLLSVDKYLIIYLSVVTKAGDKNLLGELKMSVSLKISDTKSDVNYMLSDLSDNYQTT